MPPRPDARALLRYAADACLAVAVAPVCACCRRVLETPSQGPVCADCWSAIPPLLPPLCRICGGPMPSWRIISMAHETCAACRRQPGAIAITRAVGAYEGTLRAIVHVFKYEGRRSLARRLAGMMRDSGGEVLAGASCAVPVPLYPWKQVRRGFNQAAALAAGLELPVVPALWRVRPTPPQAGLPAAARRRNMRGAFALSPVLSRHQRARLRDGAIVVLVDDVRTTGATLAACASVLAASGVAEVRALTLARAPAPWQR